MGVQAQAPDDLSVRRGDWVYADLNNQTVDGWLWAYAPKTRNSAVKRSIGSTTGCTITEKAPTRAFS